MINGLRRDNFNHEQARGCRCNEPRLTNRSGHMERVDLTGKSRMFDYRTLYHEKLNTELK
jgi:hypothetical protein